MRELYTHYDRHQPSWQCSSSSALCSRCSQITVKDSCPCHVSVLSHLYVLNRIHRPVWFISAHATKPKRTSMGFKYAITSLTSIPFITGYFTHGKWKSTSIIQHFHAIDGPNNISNGIDHLMSITVSEPMKSVTFLLQAIIAQSIGQSLEAGQPAGGSLR